MDGPDTRLRRKRQERDVRQEHRVQEQQGTVAPTPMLPKRRPQPNRPDWPELSRLTEMGLEPVNRKSARAGSSQKNGAIKKFEDVREAGAPSEVSALRKFSPRVARSAVRPSMTAGPEDKSPTSTSRQAKPRPK